MQCLLTDVDRLFKNLNLNNLLMQIGNKFLRTRKSYWQGRLIENCERTKKSQLDTAWFKE